jgi:glycine/D-amino acid oxidase-like deaminating enzyme
VTKSNIDATPSAALPAHVDAAIIGAGFAGAAAACHLAALGAGSIAIIEMEALPGLHSSGRNAAMVRQVTADPELSAMARLGAAGIRERARSAGARGEDGLFRGSGSLLVAGGAAADRLRASAEDAAAHGLEVHLLDPRTTCARFPVLEGARFETACWCPSDGVVDIAWLLRAYLDGARSRGARVFLGAGVDGIEVGGGRVQGLRVGGRRLGAALVFNAAGGWAKRVGELAGASPMPLRPTRRHLFVTGPLPWVDRSWPFIWDIGADAYFRPESGGLLFSACDVLAPGEQLESDGIVREAREFAARKIPACFPRLAELTIRRGWSGIRTLTPDGRFIIGPDPELRGFHWVAGLGGHGVTASGAAGELAARLALSPAEEAENPFSPARFSRSNALAES